MARKLKEAVGSTQPLTIDKKFERLHTDLQNAEQKKNDGQATYASLTKKLDDLGLNRDAYKAAVKLKKMADDKQSDWLRSFNALIAFWGIPAQSDLFDGADEADAEDQQQPAVGAEWEGSGEPIDDPDFAEVPDAPGESGEEAIPLAAEGEGDAEAEAAPEPTWDDVDDDIDPADMPANAGEIYNSAAEHRRLGGTLDDNPYGRGTAAAKVWSRGWKQTDAELAAEAEPAPAYDEADAATEAAAEETEEGDAVDAGADGATTTDDDFEADVVAAEAEFGDEPIVMDGEEAAGSDNVTPFPAPAAADEDAEAPAVAEEPTGPKRRRRAAAASTAPAPAVARSQFTGQIDGQPWTV